MNVLVKNRFTKKVYYALIDEKTIKVLVDNDWITFHIDALRVLFEIVDQSNMFVHGN